MPSKKYYEENKEQIRERAREYYRRNKEKLIASQKEYYQKHKSAINSKKKVRNKKYYQNNKTEILTRNEAWRQKNIDKVKAKKREDYHKNKHREKKRVLAYRKHKKQLVDTISVHYGCQNPDCRWAGQFLPCHLDFHHLDPKTKRHNIAQIVQSKKEIIAEEINKCVVLCRNCHQAYHAKQFVIDPSKICRVTTNLEPISLPPC